MNIDKHTYSEEELQDFFELDIHVSTISPSSESGDANSPTLTGLVCLDTIVIY